ADARGGRQRDRLRSRSAREQDPGQERGRGALQGQGRRGPSLQRPRQSEADGAERGKAPRLAQSVRAAEGRRKSAGLHRGRVTMAMKKNYKPTSPGIRFQSHASFDDLTRTRPEKALT